MAQSGSLNVTVVGTGYVGLGTAVMLAYLGHSVTGLDIDQEKVDMLSRGELPIYEPGLDRMLIESRERIRWTTDYGSAIPQADVIFICVGTPSNVDGSPNLRYVSQAAQSVAENLNGKTQVIVNKSTVPVGTGDWVTRIIEDHARSYHANRYLVVSNPEFSRRYGPVRQPVPGPDRARQRQSGRHRPHARLVRAAAGAGFRGARVRAASRGVRAP